MKEKSGMNALTDALARLKTNISSAAKKDEMHEDTPSFVVRYAVTHLDDEGMRTLCGPAQGRFTHETAEDAQARLDAMMANNRLENGKLAGVYGLPLEVRSLRCYPGHFDPMEVYFPESDGDDAQDAAAPRMGS